MKTQKQLSLLTAAILVLVSLWGPVRGQAATVSNQILVHTSLELFTALRNAEPGDEIIVATGFYEGQMGTGLYNSGHSSSFFYSDRSGTADAPIILRSEDPENKSVLSGTRINGQVLYITGDYWSIRDLDITYGLKGVILDHSNHTELLRCNVYNTGEEAIHLRDNSNYNLIDGCTVTDTGSRTPGYGEGIYVGTYNGDWNTYDKECDYNVIQNCTLGPNITAESLDIKEGTTGTVVRNCTMYGAGISGENYADSFLEIKGNDVLLEGNTAYRNNNPYITMAFQVHQQLDGWGLRNSIMGNTVYMDIPTGYVVNAPTVDAFAGNNIRIPAGDMYSRRVTVIDD